MRAPDIKLPAFWDGPRAARRTVAIVTCPGEGGEALQAEDGASGGIIITDGISDKICVMRAGPASTIVQVVYETLAGHRRRVTRRSPTKGASHSAIGHAVRCHPMMSKLMQRAQVTRLAPACAVGTH